MTTLEEQGGGRIFFSSTGRSLVEEDEIVVLSVGVDIGSSTSHLVFSRIVLERLDSRYVVSAREAFYQSDILLTPYSAAEEIDAQALGAFIARQYQDANVDPDEIDTGALILTGVAVRRRNARNPRQGDGDEYRRRRRHLEDRDLLRRTRERRHGG
jgi:ethanolamine utilization protein EutA